MVPPEAPQPLLLGRQSYYFLAGFEPAAPQAVLGRQIHFLAGFERAAPVCGKTIIDEETLKEFKSLWKSQGINVPNMDEEINHFGFGNGQSETCQLTVKLPV